MMRPLALLAATFTALLAAQPSSAKLNVLFIAVDDLRPELGCYGADHVRSPRIDRLAAEGVLFRRAYCQQALCNPSRTSLMTGLRPDSVGVVGNHVYFRDRHADIATLPQHFKRNGYRSVGIGKLYHGPFPAEAGAMKWDKLDDPPSWSEPAIRFGPRYYFTPGGIAAARVVYDKRNRGRNVPPDDWENHLLFGPMTEAPDVPDKLLYDGKVGDATVAKLRELKKAGKPFFLAAGFIKPHTPFIAPKRYWDLYDPAELPMPAAEFMPWKAPSFAGHNSSEIRRYTDQPNKGPFSEANKRNLRHGYFACVSFIDAQVGRILDELARLDLDEETVVVLWGDHGYHLGEQSLWGKVTCFENAARVPLIVRAPGARGNGQATDALVELVDLYPTLCDIAGLTVPQHLEGHSFAPLLSDPSRPWKRAAFTLHPRGGNWDKGGSLMGRSLRTDRYRYTEWTRRSDGKLMARELYDHVTDPREEINVADEPVHAQLVIHLSRQLRAGWRAALPGSEATP